MFDIGWSEMAVIALVALIVIGPKDLPHAMRAAAKWARKARGLAREFQSGVDDMIREADLEDARQAVEATRRLDLDSVVEETIDPTGSVRDEAQSIERTARSADGDDTPERKPAQPEAEAPRASVIEHPAKVAPAHSVTPPAEDGAPESPGAASGSDASQKRA